MGRWPQRYVVVSLAFAASTLAYTDRVNLAVAAVAMRQQFGWSQTQKGFALSAFFVGYLAFMFVAGLLATRFGGRRLLGTAVLAWSICTLLTPIAASTSLVALVVVRIGMGVGEASMYPASYDLFSRWVPLTERARAVGWLLNGIPVGTLAGLIGSGWLVERYGWPSVFYVFGACGFVWALAWFRQVADDPATCPRIGGAERAFLCRADATAAADVRIPLHRLLLRTRVLGIVAGHFATTWTLYVLISWLPSYFREAQGLSIANAGLFSAAPWIAMLASTIVGGSLSDRLISRGVGVTFVRKLMQCAGLLLSALFLLSARDAHSPATALVLLCAATGALGLTWCGFAPGIIDVAPRRAVAILGGFSNSIATIPGIVGVAVTGWLVDLTGTYSAAFVLTAAVSVAGALVFGLCFNARPLVN
jgi:ACS family sodium-dependent inorganic phosphate cotransporter